MIILTAIEETQSL